MTVDANMSSARPRRGMQVDPGFHWTRSKISAGTTRIFDVLATKTSSGTFGALKEYWYGYSGGATALNEATALTLDHEGDYDWRDYPTKWNANTPAGRNGDCCDMPVVVSYTATGGSEPDDVFEGSISVGGTTVMIRLYLEVDTDGDLAAVAWYHNGSSDPTFIVNSGASITLTKQTSVSWPSGWKKYSFTV